MPSLRNNRELYEYLGRTASALGSAGRPDLERLLRHAMGHVSMSTEFLGESRMALRRVLADGAAVLSSQERTDLIDVLAQIDHAFDRHRRA